MPKFEIAPDRVIKRLTVYVSVHFILLGSYFTAKTARGVAAHVVVVGYAVKV